MAEQRGDVSAGKVEIHVQGEARPIEQKGRTRG